MWYLAFLALAIGLGLAIAAFGSATGQGKAIQAAMEGIARQPEAAGQIQTTMIIGLAFVEALTIYSLVIGFVLVGKLPSVEQLMQMLGE